MKYFFAIALALCVTNATYGDAITNNAGQVYNVKKVMRTEPDGITIMHDAGVIKLFFWELPEDIQAKYGYDSAAATRYHQQSSAAKAQAYQQSVQNRKEAQARAEAGEFPLRAFNIQLTSKKERFQTEGTVTTYFHADSTYAYAMADASAREALTELKTVYMAVCDIKNSRNTPIEATVSFGGSSKKIIVPANDTLKGVVLQTTKEDSSVKVSVEGQTKTFSRI